MIQRTGAPSREEIQHAYNPCHARRPPIRWPVRCNSKSGCYRAALFSTTRYEPRTLHKVLLLLADVPCVASSIRHHAICSRAPTRSKPSLAAARSKKRMGLLFPAILRYWNGWRTCTLLPCLCWERIPPRCHFRPNEREEDDDPVAND